MVSDIIEAWDAKLEERKAESLGKDIQTHHHFTYSVLSQAVTCFESDP